MAKPLVEHFPRYVGMTLVQQSFVRDAIKAELYTLRRLSGDNKYRIEALELILKRLEDNTHANTG